MGAKEELIKYISNLSEEDMKKIIQRLPELISKLEAQGLPCHLLRELHQTSVGVNSGHTPPAAGTMRVGNQQNARCG